MGVDEKDIGKRRRIGIRGDKLDYRRRIGSRGERLGVDEKDWE